VPHRWDPRASRRDFLRAAGALGAAAVVQPSGLLAPTAVEPDFSRRARAEGPGPATTAFMDALWDESLGQIRFPFEEQPPPVRETSWYALGLLARASPGDVERAQRALTTVVSKQYDSPGAIFHGSYPRFAGDPPLPPADAAEFAQFDPNWRQFIGTALALAALRYGKKLGSLRTEVERSVDLAAAGERVDRVQPDYSNIAIMHAWLLAHTGDRAEGEKLAKAIAARYRTAGALDEYDSPTYDGIALYGLALWRDEPPSRVFAALGDELSNGVWRNIAAVYHPGLHNVCGPYSRAVGMDLRTYASPVGLWIWSVVGQKRAPFPDITQPFDHAGDVCFGPLVDLFPVEVAGAVRRALDRFRGEHTVRVGLDGTWGATSWLGDTVMVGGHTGAPVRVGGQQLHPATIHWAQGWIRVLGTGIDAVAAKRRLDLSVAGGATVTIGVPGLDLAAIGPERWELPGLGVDVRSDAAASAPPTSVDEGVELTYPATTLRLDLDAG